MFWGITVCSGPSSVTRCRIKQGLGLNLRFADACSPRYSVKRLMDNGSRLFYRPKERGVEMRTECCWAAKDSVLLDFG